MFQYRRHTGFRDRLPALLRSIDNQRALHVRDEDIARHHDGILRKVRGPENINPRLEDASPLGKRAMYQPIWIVSHGSESSSSEPSGDGFLFQIHPVKRPHLPVGGILNGVGFSSNGVDGRRSQR